MNKHATTLLFLAVTGAIIFSYGGPAPASKPEPQAVPTTQAGAAAQAVQYNAGLLICPVNDQLGCAADCPGYCPSKDLKGTIAGYFGENGDAPGDPLGVPSDIPRSGLQFLIATVPDPVHTHLSLLFDQSVEAVEQAIDSRDYIFASATTPWENQQHPESTNFLTQRGYEIYKQAKETFPGLLIFRWQKEDGPQQSLFVFLVAEVPTEGINKEQFHNALRAIRLIGRNGNQPAPDFRLRIVGPTFSGSLYSLNEIFARDPEAKDFPHAAVFSGTVTNREAVAWFISQRRFQDIQFPVLRQNDGDAMKDFIRYAKQQMDVPTCRIALLSEDETAYGGNPNGGKGSGDEDVDPSRSKDRCQLNEILKLKFPRDIASLRAAYQQQLREERIAEGTGKRPPRTALPLNLEDTGSDDDSIATYSHAQTPVSEDEVLSGIVSKLRAGKIRLIVLRATSTLDRLFLAQYLRTAYPQGRVVISEADRLFQSNAEGAPMRGVLALTAFPLWTGDAGRDRNPASEDSQPITFPSEHAKAVYYTTRDALDFPQSCCVTTGVVAGRCVYCPAPDPSGAVGQEPSGGASDYLRAALENSYEREHALRALWLTVVGRDGYWPIARLPPGAGDKLFNIEPTVSWTFLFLAAVLLAAIYILCTWRGSIRSNSGGMVAFAPVRDSTRSWILCVFGWILLVTLLLVVLPSHFFTSSRAWEIGGWIAVVLLVTSCFLDLRRREARLGTEHRRTRTSVWFVIFSLGLVAFFASRTSLDDIFLYRYVHASSGVSPLLPLLLLLAGGLWWAWYSLKGLVLLDARRPRLPQKVQLPVESNPSFAVLSEDANASLLKVAKPLTRDIRVWVPAGAGICAAVLLLWGLPDLRLIQSLERRSFDRLYEGALGLVLFGLMVTLFQLVLTWVECRSFLRSLDRLPLRRAFNDLKELSWGSMWQLSAGGLNDLNAIFVRELESLTHLHNTPALVSDPTKLASSIKTAKICLDCVRKFFGQAMGNQGSASNAVPWKRAIRTGMYRDETDLIRKIECLRSQLACVCGEALQFLWSRWEKEAGPVLTEGPNGDEGQSTSAPKDPEAIKVRAVERFVCLVYVNFIFIILRQIRNLLTIMAGLFVFAVLSLSSYPFVPTATIRSVMLLLFLALAAVAAMVYSQMHTDSTLSRITGTSASKLGGDFWLRLGSAVGLPLIGLLAYQFPQVNNLLFSWLQPALQALK